MNRSMILLLLLVCAATAHAQERPRWQRRADPVQPPLSLFHSTQSLNLPTAETMQKGEFQFEISHRFLGPVSDGPQAFWGFDGRVNIRLGLGYAFTDRLVATVARSNQDDNIDFQLKYRALEIRNDVLPLMVGVLGGGAWNTEVANRGSFDRRSFQAYGQLIVNTVINDRVGLGVVTSYLHNAIIQDDDLEQTISVGLYSHYYASEVLALLVEWNISDSIATFSHDAFSLGIHLETGGHFFKIMLSNSTSLNPSQFLLGTGNAITADEMRLGFNVTRLLR